MSSESNKIESLVRELRDQSSSGSLQRSKLEKRFSGWRLGALLAFAAVSTVLLCNVIFTIWAAVSFGVKDGIGTIYEGSCGKSKSISLWLHLVINVFGTVLLSGSNYCRYTPFTSIHSHIEKKTGMQRLSAPSRGDIDRAHAKHRWLDIGIPSVRNFGSMGMKRKILWILLGASSVPLHLFYNSAIFSQLAVYSYGVYVIQENFLTGTKPNWSETFSDPYGIQDTEENVPDIIPESEYIQETISQYRRIENVACIEAYSTPFPTSRGDVLVVTVDNTTTESLLDWDRPFQLAWNPLLWLCNNYRDPENDMLRCDVAKVLENPDKFAVRGYPIDYCLTREWPEKCKVQFSLIILCVVIAGNCIKATCMLATLYVDIEGLVTIGDAISSFLKTPDETTVGMCLVNRRTIAKTSWKEPSRVATRWKASRHFWFQALSMARWLICNLLCCIAVGIGGFLLFLGLDTLKTAGIRSLSLSALWNLGFGALDAMSLTTLPFTDFLRVVLLVNLPQLLLTFLFLTYNAVFTCELIGLEWNKFSRSPTRLRVTDPNGQQRSTRYLGLPYRYAIPLATVSATLHWTVSQSLFLANLAFYASDGSEALVLQDSYGASEVFSRFNPRKRFADSNTTYRAGYSSIAIICTIVLGVITILIGIAFGFRGYEAGIPLVRSCSAAIAAACHPSETEPEDMAEQPLKWGVVSISEDGIAHCALSSQWVTTPVEGQLCA